MAIAEQPLLIKLPGYPNINPGHEIKMRAVRGERGYENKVHGDLLLLNHGGGLAVERVGPHGQGEEIRVIPFQILHVIQPLIDQ